MPDPLTVTEIGDRTLRIERRFEAPPALVWRAFTDADLLPRWMGMRDYPLVECRVDLVEGRTARYVWRGPTGAIGLTMRFVALEPPRRIVHTEIFDEDWTGGETRVETVLTGDAGGTRMRMDILYASAEARSGARATGMTEGMEACYKALDALVPELAAA